MRNRSNWFGWYLLYPKKYFIQSSVEVTTKFSYIESYFRSCSIYPYYPSILPFHQHFISAVNKSELVTFCFQNKCKNANTKTQPNSKQPIILIISNCYHSTTQNNIYFNGSATNVVKLLKLTIQFQTSSRN